MITDKARVQIRSFMDAEHAWHAVIWMALFLLLAALLQLHLPYPLDDDTAYHYIVGGKIRELGPLQSFPWTTFSWMRDHYGDKEFLFHVLFVPFARYDMVTASRIVGSIAGAILLSALFLVIRAERVAFPALWTLLPIGASYFIFRFAQVRPHLLSIAFALVFLWSYARGRTGILAAVSFLFPLSYVAFWQIPLILAASAEAGRVLAGKRLNGRTWIVVLIGIIAGVVVHPNSYNLLQSNWIHMYDILLKNAWGNKVEFNLGGEFEPISIMTWVTELTIMVVLVCAAAIYAWKRRREDNIPLVFVLAAVCFGLLTVRTSRFLEYFVPFTAAAAAISLRLVAKWYVAPVLLAVALIWTAIFGRTTYQHLGSVTVRNGYLSSETAQRLAGLVPKGSQVFTCGWEYTGGLLVALPERYFMVALDPTLFYVQDPALYDLWYRTLLEAPSNSADIIRTNFKSRFVLCQGRPDLWPFFDALVADDRVAFLLNDHAQDPQWLLFELYPKE